MIPLLPWSGIAAEIRLMLNWPVLFADQVARTTTGVAVQASLFSTITAIWSAPACPATA
jgi:hypothetical protein